MKFHLVPNFSYHQTIMSNFALTVEYFKKLPDGTRECSDSSVAVGDNQSIEFKLPRDEPGTLVTTVWDKDGKEVSKAGDSIGPGSFIITCFGNGNTHPVNPGGCAKWYDTENGLVLDQGTYDLGQVDREPGTGTTFQTADGHQYVRAPTGQTYQLAGPRR